MSSLALSLGNNFYGRIENTEVSKEQLYISEKNNLSVVRQISGIVTIPTGTSFVNTTALYFPITQEDGITQITLPKSSIVKKTLFSAIPFGSIESTIAISTITSEANVDTTMYTVAVPYTSIIPIAITTLNIVNQNVSGSLYSSNGIDNRIFGIVVIQNTVGGSTLTTTHINKFKVTFYCVDSQDLNK